MRLIENSNTRKIFNILNEDIPINDEDKKERLIPIGLTDNKSKDVINAVIGQMSDGMWENSPGMERYWKFADGLDDKGNIVVYDGYERRDRYNGIDRYGITKYKPHWSYSAFSKMDDTAVKRFFAAKIKQIVKEEGLEWNRNNTEHCEYLDYNSGVTVRDAYRVYDRLLGRIDRITEGVPFGHTTTIYYGTNEDGTDDVGEIECIVDNRDDFPEISDEQLDKAFESSNLDIWNNDLSGEEFMEDIPIEDGDYWLFYKGKDSESATTYHFNIDKNAFNESAKINKKALKETTDEEYDEYMRREKERAEEGYKDICTHITDKQREKFNGLKEMLTNESEGTMDVDGWYFATDAVYAVNNSGKGHHMNPYMDLTTSNILLMVDENNSIEEAIKELFDEYKPDSAYSWADNFLYALDKVNLSAYQEFMDEQTMEDEMYENAVNELVSWMYNNFPDNSFYKEGKLENGDIVYYFDDKGNIDKVKEAVKAKFGDEVSFGTARTEYAPEMREFVIICKKHKKSINESAKLNESTTIVNKNEDGSIYVKDKYGEEYNFKNIKKAIQEFEDRYIDFCVEGDRSNMAITRYIINKLYSLNESVKTQDFINSVGADNDAKRLAGISGNGDMTLDQYMKYQDYLHEIRKKDTSRYDITIEYWDRNGYPQDKSYVGRSLKQIASKFIAAKDRYDFKEISDYSDNLYDLLNNSVCDNMEEYLERIANGETPEQLKLEESVKPDKKEDYFADIYYKHQDKPHKWTKQEVKDWIQDELTSGNTLYKLDNKDINLLYNFQHKLYKADIEDLNEASKLIKEESTNIKREKQEDKRVIMQQGNITCIKENETYLVFENEADNEVEHDTEESAMQDFLERCGVDPNNELEETKE